MLQLVVMGKTESFEPELFFSALADKTRLRLLSLMRDGEVCVCFFAAALETNNPKISRHLSYLKRASLVKARREGKWMHYQINEPSDPNAAQVFAATMKMLDADDQMRLDRDRLLTYVCSPRAVISITGRSTGSI
jgi:ArsR family transcriptional regulator